MKRASDVPPVVDSSHSTPATSRMAPATRSLSGPGGVKKDLPETSTEANSIVPLPPSAALARSMRSLRCASSVLDVHRSLKRVLKRAFTTPGAMLVALLPTSTVVNCSEVGWKCVLPLSIGSRTSASISADRRWMAIVEPLGIGDMALDAAHHHVDGHAAAPADLHHVAEALGAGRLADHAGVDRLAALGQALQHLDRAVDRGPLLVAGDQQADRAAEVAAAPRQEARRRRR